MKRGVIMIETLNLTISEVKENVKSFNYDIDEYETVDNGTAIIVYQSSYYRIIYYFDSNGKYEDFEIEDLTKI